MKPESECKSHTKGDVTSTWNTGRDWTLQTGWACINSQTHIVYRPMGADLYNGYQVTKRMPTPCFKQDTFGTRSLATWPGFLYGISSMPF